MLLIFLKQLLVYGIGASLIILFNRSSGDGTITYRDVEGVESALRL